MANLPKLPSCLDSGFPFARLHSRLLSKRGLAPGASSRSRQSFPRWPPPFPAGLAPIYAPEQTLPPSPLPYRPIRREPIAPEPLPSPACRERRFAMPAPVRTAAFPQARLLRRPRRELAPATCGFQKRPCHRPAGCPHRLTQASAPYRRLLRRLDPFRYPMPWLRQTAQERAFLQAFLVESARPTGRRPQCPRRPPRQ
ncbi:MAG: hypothetical protein CAPSK01_001774 [Candidatus Accumulibacter vicinus]|uniref:Uncharacterized protein n=1 Tax=Candidatus Accumulibacter vicinus TaxID=2954382 RepID=A0A084Y2H5_9PROT|nr:MAG: hypothetical protein CAPSK01_001774 [Candidatus Accumulibacter vicinus]